MGDSFHNDIEPAIDLGIKAVLISDECSIGSHATTRYDIPHKSLNIFLESCIQMVTESTTITKMEV